MIGPERVVLIRSPTELRPLEYQHIVGQAVLLHVGIECGDSLREVLQQVGVLSRQPRSSAANLIRMIIETAHLYIDDLYNRNRYDHLSEHLQPFCQRSIRIVDRGRVRFERVSELDRALNRVATEFLFRRHKTTGGQLPGVQRRERFDLVLSISGMMVICLQTVVVEAGNVWNDYSPRQKCPWQPVVYRYCR